MVNTCADEINLLNCFDDQTKHISAIDHLSFAVADTQKAAVFHEAVLAAYYAAFVIDLDGNRLEAVCRRPE